MSNSLIPFFGVTAGITDAALLVVVLGTMFIALFASVLVLVGWLRGR